MSIALTAITVTGTEFIHVIIMAATPVSVSLFMYDIWDALRALDARSNFGGDRDHLGLRPEEVELIVATSAINKNSVAVLNGNKHG